MKKLIISGFLILLIFLTSACDQLNSGNILDEVLNDEEKRNQVYNMAIDNLSKANIYNKEYKGRLDFKLRVKEEDKISDTTIAIDLSNKLIDDKYNMYSLVNLKTFVDYIDVNIEDKITSLSNELIVIEQETTKEHYVKAKITDLVEIQNSLDDLDAIFPYDLKKEWIYYESNNENDNLLNDETYNRILSEINGLPLEVNVDVIRDIGERFDYLVSPQFYFENDERKTLNFKQSNDLMLVEVILGEKFIKSSYERIIRDLYSFLVDYGVETEFANIDELLASNWYQDIYNNKLNLFKLRADIYINVETVSIEKMDIDLLNMIQIIVDSLQIENPTNLEELYFNVSINMKEEISIPEIPTENILKTNQLLDDAGKFGLFGFGVTSINEAITYFEENPSLTSINLENLAPRITGDYNKTVNSGKFDMSLSNYYLLDGEVVLDLKYIDGSNVYTTPLKLSEYATQIENVEYAFTNKTEISLTDINIIIDKIEESNYTFSSFYIAF